MMSNNNAHHQTDNNRQQNRDQLAMLRQQPDNSTNNASTTTTTTKQGLTAGFEYAVQPDGSSLAEQKWRELRRQAHTCFCLYQPPTAAASTNGRLQQRPSLNALENQVQNASRQYTQSRSVPDAPQLVAAAPTPAAATNSSGGSNSGFSAAVTLPPPPPRQNNNYSNHINSSSTSANAPTMSSPPHRIRNYHNNNSGGAFQHQQSAGGFQTASSLGSSNNNNNHSTTTSFQSAVEEEEYDDEIDDVIASVDMENIGYSSQPSNNSIVAKNNNRKPPPPPVQQDEFDLYDDDEQPPSAPTASTIYSNVTNNNNNFGSYNNNNGANSSFDCGASHHHNNNSFASSTAASFNNNNNNFQEGGSYDASSLPTFGGAMPQSSIDAPLCPGHNHPCRLLTSSTEANNGRQFYKCSLPEDQQCQFFEWADGMTGNWNNSIDGSAAACFGSGGEVKDALTESRRKFGHRSFRPGQKEVIDNAVAGRDVFVLMPTGGGKSLCYQLPAWCCPGLTVVISPLLSLIQDQVQSMTKLGIDTVFLASSQDFQTEQMEITRRLNAATAHGGIKLLYLTPEKLNNSQMMQKILRGLHNKKLLSRFVIDEAHCLSDWGHDFRPDYNKLGMLRREYPGVPLMALTATANEKVVTDAIRALEMRNEYRYVSSFNRPNLHYEVRKKDGKTIDAIADYVAKRPNDSGVIYCLSRKDCEVLAGKLQEKVRTKPGCSRLRVSFYHADLDAHEREQRHVQWSNGIISVLCATVAFGMGIDKPDVRFVIHYSMPKSITHYYQESGRAGRDRDDADCILYYSYKDKKILENMIVKSSNDPYSQATRRKVDQLYTCVRYCEDEFRCRRTMQLEFFGETFDRSKCNQTCDNCRAQREPDRRDLTDIAQAVLQLFSDVSQQKRGNGVTLAQLTDLFRGSKSQSSTKFLDTSRLHGYGAGSKYKKYEVDRIAHAMVFDRIIVETCVQNKGGYNSDYVNLGENAMSVQNGSRKFFVDFPKEAKKTVAAGKENNKKKSKSSEAKATKKKKASGAAKKKTPTAKASGSVKTLQQPSVFNVDDSEEDNDEDDGLDVASAPRSAGSRADAPSVLPQASTQELIARIKTLATNWAEEERMYGKTIFYWNILKNDAMKTIASQVPMTIEELQALGLLGENIIKEYGERIVKVVSSYVAQENLEEYINRRPSKRAKVDAAGAVAGATMNSVVVLDDSDEFDDGIDYSAIEMSDSKPAAKAAKPKKTSHYF